MITSPPHGSLKNLHSNAAHWTRRDALAALSVGGLGALFARAGRLSAQEKLAADAPTPMPAAAVFAQPGAYQFRIGAIEAWAFNDGGFAPLVAEAPFYMNEPREKLADNLRAAFLPTDRVDLQFNVLLVKIGSERVLIDAGCGAAFGPAGGKLLAQMATAGFTPADITGVVLTHAHGDHMGGLLDAQGVPVFRNAQHFVAKAERQFWLGAAPDMSGYGVDEANKVGFVKAAQGVLGATTLKWQEISGGEKLLGGLEIIAAPGHTPGHLAVMVASGNAQLLHIADAAHHHALTLAHPEGRIAFDGDSAAALSTRRALLDRASADRIKVFGAHMPFPALGHVRRVGLAYEWVVAPWSFLV
jgi:glyoxylase-like metal-dependent hydrolase (beta-lactamase superfamily II)